MTNSEKVQAAIAVIRKRWMEMHGGMTPQECRSALLTAGDVSNDGGNNSGSVETR